MTTISPHLVAYNLYDKPLFQGGSSGQLYRPNSDADPLGGGEDMLQDIIKTDRFKPAKSFAGAEGGVAEGSSVCKKAATCNTLTHSLAHIPFSAFTS